jgi:hypothetical protein
MKKKPTAKKKTPSRAKKPTRATTRGASCPQPPPGTVASEVIFIIEGLTVARPVRDTATLDDLGLSQQRLTICLNTHFFLRPKRGIPDGTFDGETRVSQVVGTVHRQLAAQGIDRP